MIGDNAIGVIEQARKLNQPTRMCISQTSSPLTFMAGPDTNSDLILTNGLYHLVFNTLTRNLEPNVNKFCTTFDFGRKFWKFSGWADFIRQAETNDYVAFFLKYTNICEEMFTIAALNPGMHIPFVFDIVKYYKEVMANAGWTDIKKYHMIINPYRPDDYGFWKVDDNGELIYRIEKKGAEKK